MNPEEQAAALALAERVVIDAIKGGDVTAAMFYLKFKGRDCRLEDREAPPVINGVIVMPVYDWSRLSDAEFDTLIDLADKASIDVKAAA